jgi:hypothetical protein
MPSAIAVVLALLVLALLPILQPVLHDGFSYEALKDSALRAGAATSFLVPGLIGIFHPPSRCKPFWRGLVYWLRIGMLILAPVGYATLFINQSLGIFLLGCVVVMFVALRLAWVRASVPIPKWSPARAVYEEGLRVLAQETDPSEKRKLQTSLERFKESWRLK